MPPKKISQLTAGATPFDRSTQSIPCVQSGVTDKVSMEDVAGIYDTGWIQIPSADVLQLYTTPIEIVAAPGVGYYLRIVRADGWIDYNTTPYATSTIVVFKHASSNKPLFSLNKLLAASTELGEMGVLQDTVSAGDELMKENEAIDASTFTALDPTAGDSDIYVRVCYEIVAKPY